MVAVTDPWQLPLGVRFRPTDEEKMKYLENRVRGVRDNYRMIPDVDMCSCDPGVLSGLYNDPPIIRWDNEVQEGWFFSPYKAKIVVGGSTKAKRLTSSGYWKQTGTSKVVKDRRTKTIGKRNILVFHIGKGKNAKKTDWVIHEYHPPGNALDTHVLCCLRLKRDKKVDNSTIDSEYEAEWPLCLYQPDPVPPVNENSVQAMMNSLRGLIPPENRGQFLQQPQPAPGYQNYRLPSDIHQLTNTLGPSVMDMLFENDLTDGDIQLMFGRGEEDEDVRHIESADHAHADFPDDLMLKEGSRMNQRARTTDSVRSFVPVKGKKVVVENKFNGSTRAKVQEYKERDSAGNSTKKTNSQKIGYAKKKSNSVAASTGTTSESTKTSTNAPLANLVDVLLGIFLLLIITRLVFNF